MGEIYNQLNLINFTDLTKRIAELEDARRVAQLTQTDEFEEDGELEELTGLRDQIVRIFGAKAVEANNPVLFNEGHFQDAFWTGPRGLHDLPFVYTYCIDSGQGSVREARARFTEQLDAAEPGNVTVITRHGRAAATMASVALLDQLGKPDGEQLPPGVGSLVEVAAAVLRDALRALEPLLGRETAPPAAAEHAVPH